MIVAEIKPFEEIVNMVRDRKKVLILGCGSCVSVCMPLARKLPTQNDDIVVPEMLVFASSDSSSFGRPVLTICMTNLSYEDQEGVL